MIDTPLYYVIAQDVSKSWHVSATAQKQSNYGRYKASLHRGEGKDFEAVNITANTSELALEIARNAAAAPKLLQAVIAAKEMSDWFMKHSRQADHAHSELKEKMEETTGWKELIDSGYNGLMASFHGQFEEAISEAMDKP